MITFDLKSGYNAHMDCYIQVGRYPVCIEGEQEQYGWHVVSCYGEMIGTPTVNLADYGLYPGEGNVFIKTNDEYQGWLESLVSAGIVEDLGVSFDAGRVKDYARQCKVLKPELLRIDE